MNTYLRTDFLTDLDSKEAVTYTALKMLYDKNKILTKKVEMVELSFSIEQLYWELSGSFNPNRYDKDKLKDSLKALEELEAIKILDTDDKSNYVVDATNFYIHSVKNGDDYNDVYVMADREEIRKIFNLGKGRNYGLLRFAMLLFSTVNNSEDAPYFKCGFMAQETAIVSFNLSGYQIYQDYFKALEDNSIIYVHHSKRTKIDDKGIKTLSNIYGRYADKVYVDNYAEYQEEEQAHDFRQLPDHALVTKDYNKYCRKPDKFTREQVLKLYDVCRRYNDMPLQREGLVEKYDLSVFPA